MTDELKAEREAFEKWIISLGPFSLKRSSHTGEDIDSWVEIEFEAWQARAKLYRTQIASPDVVRDAERYRWLIQQSDKADSIIQHHDPKMWNNLIDSAMKEDSHDHPTD